MYYNLRLIGTVGPKKPVFVSMTVQLLTALAVGAVGVMSPESNGASRLCMSVTDSYKRGDYATAVASFGKVMRLSAVLAKYQNPRSQKAALTLLGRPRGGRLRRPYLPLDEEAHKDIGRGLDELEIREIEGLA
jgi:dihydrodipicolinate synthase/N-acetylneuraminate lyase